MSQVGINKLEIDEPQRSASLSHAVQKLAVWGYPRPSGEALVMDFGLGQFEEIGLVEFWIANELDAGYCGKYMLSGDGQQCPRHLHRIKHETFFVVHGCFEITFGDESFTIREGDTVAIPPGHLHSFRGVGESLLLELSMPCEISDNYFEDPRIDSWLRMATMV